MSTNDEFLQRFTKTITCQPLIDHKGWARILYRTNNKMNLTYKGILTADDIQKMKIKHIAFSDNEYSPDTNESWYIENVKFSTNTRLPINQVIANVFNGKTPTGTQWSQKYKDGYLFYTGILKTYGDCRQFSTDFVFGEQNINIGSNTVLMTGGSSTNTGQFINMGYDKISKKPELLITNIIGWKNKRVIWVK